VRIRGAESNHSLVLLDGIPVNSLWFGAFDFADTLIDNIERAEILRGTQSSLYGSEAIGGVISLTSRSEGDAQRGSFSFRGGKNRLFRETFSTDGKSGGLGYSLSASRTDFGGQFSNDAYENSSLSAGFTVNPTEESALKFTSHYFRTEKEIAEDTVLLQPVAVIIPDENNKVDRRFRLHSLSYETMVGDLAELQVRGGWFGERLDNRNPLDPGRAFITNDNDFDLDTGRYHFTVQSAFYLGEADVLIVGSEYQRDDLDADLSTRDALRLPFLARTTDIDRTRNVKSFFVQNNFSWKETFLLNAGFRIDDNSTFGTETHVKLSSSWLISALKTRVKGGWGTGFRAPTFAELYLEPFGNPDLDPEESETYEIGFETVLDTKRISFEVVYFNTLFDDLIERDIQSLSTRNIERARSRGVEVGLRWLPLEEVTLRANYSYLDTENKQTGDELVRRPRNKWNLVLDWLPSEGVHVHCDLHIVGSQHEELDRVFARGRSLRGRNAGHTLLNLVISRRFSFKDSWLEEVELFMRGDNLLDDDYDELKGFPAPGVSYQTGFKATF
jgi:vitamin B12 transporter